MSSHRLLYSVDRSVLSAELSSWRLRGIAGMTLGPSIYYAVFPAFSGWGFVDVFYVGMHALMIGSEFMLWESYKARAVVTIKKEQDEYGSMATVNATTLTGNTVRLSPHKIHLKPFELNDLGFVRKILTVPRWGNIVEQDGKELYLSMKGDVSNLIFEQKNEKD